MSDETKKVIIIDVEIKEGDAQKNVDKLTNSITILKAETKDLQAINKTLEADGKVLSTQYLENTKTIMANQESIKQNTTERRLLVQSLGAEDNSLKALKISNQQLKQERDQLNVSTEEGVKRLGEINDQLKENKEALDKASEATEKGRFTWASFKSGLDAIIPGLGGMVTGIESAMKAGLAFIATPIGAVIGAIGLALGSLIAYFKSSEEGQNNLNKIMLIGKTVIEQLKNFVEDLGKKLFDAFSNPKQAIIDLGNFIKDNIVNRIVGMIEFLPKMGEAIDLVFKGKFKEAGTVALDALGKATIGVTGLTDKIIDFTKTVVAAVDTGIAQGKKLADMQAELDRNNRELIVQRAKTEEDVAKLRDKALTQEKDARKATIAEAIKLIQDLSDKEVYRANLLLAQAKLELQANGDDKEAKLKVAEATAAVIRAEASRYIEAFKLRKQFEALDAQELAAQQKLLADKEKARKDAADQEWADEVAKRQLANEEMDKQAAADLKREQDAAKKKEEIEKQTTKAVIDQIGIVSKNKEAARVAGNVLFKQDAMKQIFTNTKSAAMGAYNSLASIPFVGPVLGGIAAGAIIAFGAIQEAAVAGLTFRRGGAVPKLAEGGLFAATIGGRSHAQGGTKYWGEDGVQFEAEADEGIFVLNKTAHRSLISDLSNRNQREGNGVSWLANPIKNQYATGGEVLSAQADRTISNDRQLRQIADLILNQPRKVVVVEEVTVLQSQQANIKEAATF